MWPQAGSIENQFQHQCEGDSSSGEPLLGQTGTSTSDKDPAHKAKPKRSSRQVNINWTVVLGLVLLCLLIAALFGLIMWLIRQEEHSRKPLQYWRGQGSSPHEVAVYPTDLLRDVVPIPCHSHNDYWRLVPLFSAIEAGCIGVEADVWLRGGDLLVGHDTAALQRRRTFQSLYVNPLVDILESQNPTTEFYDEKRRGVFDMGPEQTLILLVDVKSDGADTFNKVLEQLEPLRARGWLSHFDNGEVVYGPVTVVGTGNAPFESVIENGTHRDVFFDAPIDKLEGSQYNSTNSYYSSAALAPALGGNLLGNFRQGQLDAAAEDQLATMRKQLQEAHARGLLARYWELPAWPIHVRNRVWTLLTDEGIDILNVDDLEGAAQTDWTKPGSGRRVNKQISGARQGRWRSSGAAPRR